MNVSKKLNLSKIKNLLIKKINVCVSVKKLDMSKKILLTWGAGFIGHQAVENFLKYTNYSLQNNDVFRLWQDIKYGLDNTLIKSNRWLLW